MLFHALAFLLVKSSYTRPDSSRDHQLCFLDKVRHSTPHKAYAAGQTPHSGAQPALLSLWKLTLTLNSTEALKQNHLTLEKIQHKLWNAADASATS